jgi:hypothetical protein
MLATSTLPTAVSEIFSRGDSLLVTSEVVEAGTDRVGNCWLSLVDDVESQILKWGEPYFARGLFPADVDTWEDARDPRYRDAYMASRRRLRGLPEGAERRAAEVAHARRFPTPPDSSQELARYLR